MPYVYPYSMAAWGSRWLSLRLAYREQVDDATSTYKRNGGAAGSSVRFPPPFVASVPCRSGGGMCPFSSWEVGAQFVAHLSDQVAEVVSGVFPCGCCVVFVKVSVPPVVTSLRASASSMGRLDR